MGIGAAVAGMAVTGAMAALGVGKAKFEVYRPQPRATGKATSAVPDKQGPPTETWKFDYNPKTVTRSRSAETTPSPAPAATGAPVSFNGATPMKFQDVEFTVSLFELEDVIALAASGLMGGLDSVAKKMLQLVEAHVETIDARKVTTRPIVRMVWGPLDTGLCHVDAVNIVFDQFLPTGQPLRMKATFTLTAISAELPKTNPTSGGPPGRKAHTLLAGESLATVAFNEYGSANLWRAIAMVNGIDDPLRLTSGTTLMVPLLPEAEELV